MSDDLRVTRRTGLKGISALGAAAWLGGGAEAAGRQVKIGAESAALGAIRDKVWATPFIDTHEHLPDEDARLAGGVRCDDWALLFSHYIDSDLMVAGMSDEEMNRFLSTEVDPLDKWSILEPYWPAVKNTGYGLASRIAIRELYGVDELSAETVAEVQKGYEALRQTGFYEVVLRNAAKIESCQVNAFHRIFHESSQPEFMMQDINGISLLRPEPSGPISDPTGIAVTTLESWYRIIDWWFEKYESFAVATKSQHAYWRDLDHARVPAEQVGPVFERLIAGEAVSPEEQKALEDNLFWHVVNCCNRHQLPVKLHTGYYAGHGYMPLGRLLNNAGSASDLCAASKETPFVFMHICYPYYEELISVAKHHPNAHLDMCWAWIINPIAAKDFLKKYLVTAPANKVLTFGGDYIPVEPVLGHAVIARRGIAQALSELVEEGWMSIDDALALTDPIMHGNARRIFRLDEKEKALKNVPW